jgi:site-specific recombinase XerD
MATFGRVREPKKQPLVLSREQVERMIECSESIKAKAALTLLYSSGLRLSEVCNLRVTDVDSKRMILRLQQAKGNRDRIALLSPRALETLREYYRQYRPQHWLFEGRQGKPLHSRSFASYILHCRLRAGIDLKISPHTFRHSFATHLLDDGVSLITIQRLLGHASLSSTAIYTHLSTDVFQKVKSPFDSPLPQEKKHGPAAVKKKSRKKASAQKSARKPARSRAKRTVAPRRKASSTSRSRAKKGGRK